MGGNPDFGVDTSAPTAPGTPSTTSPTNNTKPTWTWNTSTDSGSGLATPAYTVQWSTDSSFSSGVNSSTSTTNSFTHSTALADGTWYFRVKATDTVGNASAYSSNGSVVVDASIFSLTSLSTLSTSSGTTITWDTSKNTSSKVDYGLTSSYGTSTSETDTAPRVSTHTVTISNFVSCTTYHYRVHSTDVATNEVISGDNTFTTSGCTGEATVDSETASTITTASGGSINLLSGGYGITLTVPASFAASDANFQIKQLDKTAVTNTTSTPTGYSVVDSYIYDLEALSDNSTAITTFNNPITVSIEYSVADVSGIDESSLKIYRWDGLSWNLLNDCTVTTATKTVSCTTTHFSVFGLFGQANTTNSISSSSSSISNSSSSTPPQCNDWVTQGTPDLFEIRTSNTTATLYFAPPPAPYSYFYISFSRKPDTFEYGTEFKQDISSGVIKYAVSYLQPNTRYYFKVRAGNGCATGYWGNTLPASTTTYLKQTKTYYKNILTAIVKPIQTLIKKLVPKDKTSSNEEAPTTNNYPTITSIPEPTKSIESNNEVQYQTVTPEKKFCILWWCF
jgi:hypothetical protein